MSADLLAALAAAVERARADRRESTSHNCLDTHEPTCADCVSHDETCGLRCHVCNDRMCEWFGPEPQPGCRTVCADCPTCDCTACGDARLDRAMEAAVVAERDARLEVAG